jgi:signal transduction histidine kinase
MERALDMGKGNFDQSIEVTSQDEIGQLTKTFNEMAKSLSEIDKMKSEFVTIASHELRTPIQAMLLSISGVLEGYSGQIDDEVREDLLLARIGIERLMRLVESLLDLSRMEARKTALNVNKISVRAIVERAIAEVKGLSEAHGHAITLHMPSDVPSIEADRDRIIQLLVNLLSNAIKYNPDGGAIILKVEQAGESVSFVSADNGYGIPASAQDRIFDKFFQADSIMSQKVGGTGLGLAISKEIVQMHGGSIGCESPLPEGRFLDLPLGGERKGSIFTVTLPLDRRAFL